MKLRNRIDQIIDTDIEVEKIRQLFLNEHIGVVDAIDLMYKRVDYKHCLEPRCNDYTETHYVIQEKVYTHVMFIQDKLLKRCKRQVDSADLLSRLCVIAVLLVCTLWYGFEKI
jgi:hypothetical protein